jgi:hypothetical protein
MTEEENHTDNSEDWVELQLKYKDYMITAREHSWIDAILTTEANKMKIRTLLASGMSLAYDFKEKQWLMKIPESIGIARDRIALALLLYFPESITRDQLSNITAIEKSILNAYLSKSKPEVNAYVAKFQNNVTLNEDGYDWALGILQSIEGSNLKGTGAEDVINEQQSDTTKDTLKQDSQ